MSPSDSHARSRRQALKAGAAAALLPLVRCHRSSTRRPPNVLLVLADDLGADVVSCYGSESHRTPAIDRLAAGGIRFDRAYATPLCVPSRAQLLTGLYPDRTGFSDNIFASASGHGTPFLDPKHRTFANELRDLGYATAVAGKWHLCSFEERPHHPFELGFDESLCWLWMEYEGDLSAPDFSPRYFSPAVIRNGTITRRVEGAFGPALYADFLIEFMQRAVRSGRPFLAYYPTVLPHAPWQGTPRQLGRVPAEPPESDAMNFPLCVAALERELERLQHEMTRLSIDEDTLLIFTSDNGTPEEILVRERGRVRPGGKGSLSEAGARVPLIARWTGTIAKGQVCDALVDSTDVLPTLLEVAGGKAPARHDGASIASRLLGREGPSRRFAYSQLRDAFAIRDARYKLYSDGRLFDLETDPDETSDRHEDPALATERAALAAAAATIRAGAPSPRSIESKAEDER